MTLTLTLPPTRTTAADQPRGVIVIVNVSGGVQVHVQVHVKVKVNVNVNLNVNVNVVPGMLELEQVGVRLDGRWVIRDIDLVCNPGESIAVVGPNGAGKTTLLRIVAGILPLDRGFITLSGEPLRGATRRRIGFVPEAADPPPFLTARDLLALCAALRDAPLPDDDQRRRLYPSALEDARIGTMSLGERRRVCLAAALVGDPAVLVLDEPENGLDAAGTETLISLLRDACARGAIILIATHDAALRDALGCRELRLADGRHAAAG